MDGKGKYYHSGGRVYASGLDRTLTRCRNGAPPPCASACPYGLDVRAVIEKLRRGSFRGAYHLLEEQLIFPRTLCAICGAPCREACEKELDSAAVPLPELEQTVFAVCGAQRPARFRIPQKPEQVAVIGAGLCGLSCACTLAAQGYTVHVFDRRKHLGGSLHELLPAEEFLPELTARTDLGNVRITLGREIKALGELEEYDCVLLATGADGAGLDRSGCKHPEKFFPAGEAAGLPKTQAVNSGRRAAAAIDAWLKTGSRPSPVDLGGCAQPERPLLRAQPMRKEDAIAQVGRCRLCDCRACLESCTLLEHYKKTPQKLVSDIKVTLNPVDGLMARTATRVISSCSDCGLCREVCPEGIDLGQLLMQARTLMNREGGLPPAFHDFWMRDMAFSCGERAAFFRPAENGDLFFPGCQLGASSPDYVERTYELLQKLRPGTGILLGCCGVPAKWAGETAQFDQRLDQLRRIWLAGGKPRFITACPTCRKTLRQALPEIEVVSLYALLAELGLPETGCAPAGPAAIFHPCSSRDDPREQESVRRLLEQKGFQSAELSDPADRDGCCGYGGHIYPAGPQVFQNTVQRRAKASALPYITYCINCRDVLTAQGKDCRHILDVLTGMDHRSAPLSSLQQRRTNRIRLKAALSGQPEQEGPDMELVVSAELRRKLDKLQILDEDIVEVIRRCERTGRYLENADGDRVGHLRQGCVTCWAVWRMEGGRPQLINSYSHRMTIEGE